MNLFWWKNGREHSLHGVSKSGGGGGGGAKGEGTEVGKFSINSVLKIRSEPWPVGQPQKQQGNDLTGRGGAQ